MADAKIDLSLGGVQSVVGGLKQVGDKIGEIGSSLAGLTAIGGTLSLGAFASMIKGSIDAADHLNDLNKSTGIAVEQLAGLQLLAKQSGSDLDAMAQSINKLSVNMGKDAEKFAKLGITAKNPVDAFKQLSDLFVAIEDPQKRAAVMAEALGKSWQGAAPALSEGGKKIGEIIEKGARLSGVTKELTENSDKFNDQLANLEILAGRFRNNVADNMLPGLISVTGAVTQAYEESGKLSAIWVAMGGLGTFLFTDEFDSAKVKLRSLREDLELLEHSQKNTQGIPILSYLLWGEASAWDAEIAAKKQQITDLQKSLIPKIPAVNAEADAKAAKEKADAKAKSDAFLRGGASAGKISDYQKLTRSINEKISADQLQLSVGHALSESEKIQSKMLADLATGSIKLTGSEKMRLEALIKNLGVTEQLIQSEKFHAEQAAKKQELSATLVRSANDEANKNEELARTFGMTGSAIALLELARLEDQLAQKISIGLCTAETTELEALIAAKKRSSGALGRVEGLEASKKAAEESVAAGKKAADELDKFLDPAKAQSFGDALKGAFGTAGDAMSKLTGTLQEYGIKQAEIEEQRGNAAQAYLEGAIDEKKYIKSIGALNDKEVKNRMGGYGDMSNAAKDFFDEGSKGYQTLDGVAKVFHAAQMAMQVKEMAQGAIAAVINQSKGDPYSAWARMAAMAAAMAALGYAVGGGFNSASGDSASAEERQKSQGTGTVLGDSAAKSESLAKAMEDLQDNSKAMLPISMDMLTALKSIDASMRGLGQILLRTAGITSGNNMGIFEGKLSDGAPKLLTSTFNAINNALLKTDVLRSISGFGGQLVNSLIGGFFGSTSQSIADSGLSIGGRVSDLRQGQGVSQYANVKTETKKYFGLSKTTSYSTKFGAVDAQVSDQIGKVFGGMADALASASTIFGKDAGEVGARLSNYIVNIPRLSLRGLSGDGLQQALNSVFSAEADRMSAAVMPDLIQFQNIGEGYFQTFIRVATGIEAGRAALETFDIAAIDYTGIIDKQGDVGAEMVRQSLLLVESFDGVTTGVGKIVQSLDGSVSDIAGVYKSMLDLRRLLGDVNLSGNDLSAYMIQGAGGVSELNSGLSSYLDKFFTPAEKAAAQIRNLTAQFERLGLSLPETKDAFRALVDGVDTSNDAGAKLAGQIISLADPFSEAMDSATSSISQFTDSLLAFRDSLLAGNYSNLSSTEKTLASKSELDLQYVLSISGDTSATGKIEELAKSFLAASKTSSIDSLGYAKDVAFVRSLVDNVIDRSAGASALGMSMPVNPFSTQKSTAEQNKVAADNSAALIVEIKALRTEVAELKAHAKKTADTLVRVTRDGESMLTEAA